LRERFRFNAKEFFWVLALWALLRPASAGSLQDLARPLEGKSQRESSSRRLDTGEYDPDSNWDNSNVAPGETKVLAHLQGPGEITHIWMTFLGPEPHSWAKKGSANHQEMLLRMVWDGHDIPDVEAPVGEFFGCGFGKRMEVKSLPVVVDDGDSYNCFWRMPFRKSAHMELVNQSEKNISLLYYNVDWVERPVAEDTPYFCAQYNQSFPVEKGKDYLVLDAQGKGHLVGVTLFVRSRSPEWFGEGDEKIYVDGEDKASIWGTGTEDYFLAAWGLKKNSTPYFGTPWVEDWGILGQRTAAYRWHIQDPIVFQKSLRFTLEHYGWIPVDENPDGKRFSWNEREDDFASVAYWYQQGERKAFGSCPGAEKRNLPSLDIVVLGASFGAPEFHGKGEAYQQTGPLWPEGGQLFFKPESQEAGWIEIPFAVEEKEPRRLILSLTRSYDYGIYQAFLDGVEIGKPIDLYAEETSLKKFHLMDFWPEPGKHTLRLECVGKSDRSSNDYVGFHALLLRERRPRVKEYGRDKDRDWRTDPVLY